ncbi:unnamed protein product, partial [Hapterophycus canaliculatus]
MPVGFDASPTLRCRQAAKKNRRSVSLEKKRQKGHHDSNPGEKFSCFLGGRKMINVSDVPFYLCLFFSFSFRFPPLHVCTQHGFRALANLVGVSAHRRTLYVRTTGFKYHSTCHV